MAITEEIRQEEMKEYERLLLSTGRTGVENLIDYIGSSDFYTAPASTKYHSSFMGGLLHHSLEVYKNLDKKTSGSECNVWREVLAEEKVGNDSIIIVALLHDICKTHFYTTELKNQKNYDQAVVAAADRRQVKHDNNGDFIWETVPAYAVDDKIPYGHGEKSVMMIENYIALKPVERYAIRWHMGFTEPKELYNTLTAAIEKYPLVMALHEADLEASYLTEDRNEQ